MKKAIATALVLALALTLCLSTTALAWDFELQEADGGTAEWTDEEAAVGDYSVKLDWPAPYRDADNNYIVPRASVVITDFPDLTIGDADSWSYWVNAPENYAPNLTSYIDTVGDESSDTTISAWPTNTPDNEWFLIDETTIGGYKGAYIVWSSNPWPSYKFDWSTVHGSYDEAEILKLLIGKGVIGTNQDITVYVDDFTINGITYSFEPPPSPPPEPKPVPPPSYIDAGGWYYGDFMVRMFNDNSYEDYRWIEDTPEKLTYRGNPNRRNTLDEPVEQVATFYYNGRTTYKLMIAEGTVVEGYYGNFAWYLEFKIINGQFWFSPALKFSNPAVLYQLEGEEWVEVLRFDQVVGHKASLSAPTTD